MGALRIILALSVALSHFGGLFGYSIAGGLISVQAFFIISGFYMATILTQKYDPRKDIGVFYTNRFLRIYSLYFLCLLISLPIYYALYKAGRATWFFPALPAAAGLDWPAKAWLTFTQFFIFGQETTLFQKSRMGIWSLRPAVRWARGRSGRSWQCLRRGKSR